MRSLKSLAIACAVSASVAFAYHASGSTTAGTSPARHAAPAGSYQVAQEPWCHYVTFWGRPRGGQSTTCIRCVTGYYSNTTWTTCPVRQAAGSGFVQCGTGPGAPAASPEMLCEDQTGVGTSSSASGGVIRVTSGTLGANCGVGRGNVSTQVAAICNGKDECTLSGHDVGNPDPAPNCAKAFAVEWQCSGQNGTRSNANPATVDETTPLTLSCRTASSGGGGSTGGMTSGTGRATAGSTGSSSISGYTGGGNTSGTGRATAGMPQVMGQQEIRDGSGRITQEAAKIYIVTCQIGYNTGRQIYIYQYLRRPGFRAILPPDWSHPAGGRDFATYNEALNAACYR